MDVKESYLAGVAEHATGERRNRAPLFDPRELKNIETEKETTNEEIGVTLRPVITVKRF